MEIYINSNDREVSQDFPVTPLNPIVKLLGVFPSPDNDYIIVPTVTGNTLTFTLPYQFNLADSHIDLEYDFDYNENNVDQSVTFKSHVDVVTPILSISEIKSALGAAFTEDEVTAVERATRFIIKSFTGQDFGHYYGIKSIYLNDSLAVELPVRVIRINSINGQPAPYVRLSPSGRVLSIPSRRHHHWYTESETGSSLYYTNGIIYAPPFRRDFADYYPMKFDIDGEWGYTSVPSEVQEAARLLVHDYSCKDATYRDRYLNAMTTADWTIEFNENAFSGTGNARADELLRPYIYVGGQAVL